MTSQSLRGALQTGAARAAFREAAGGRSHSRGVGAASRGWGGGKKKIKSLSVPATG